MIHQEISQQNVDLYNFAIAKQFTEFTQMLPTIVFNIDPLMITSIQGFTLSLDVSHSKLDTGSNIVQSTQKYNFDIQMQVGSSKILIRVTSNKLITQGPQVVNSSDKLFSYSKPTNTFYLKEINNNTFTGLIQFSEFFKYLISQNVISNRDRLTKVSLIGTATDAVLQTIIKDYQFIDNFKYYHNLTFLGSDYSKFDFDFQPADQTNGDLQYLAYPATPNGAGAQNLTIYFDINSSNTGKVRKCSGERLGYFDDGFHKGRGKIEDYNYFPLNPANETRYYADFSARIQSIDQPQVSQCFVIVFRTDIAQKNFFYDLSNQSFVSKKIFVCKQSILAMQQGYIQSVNYTDLPVNSTKTTFKLYEKLKTQTQPAIYTFVPEQPLAEFGIDLFYFVKVLRQQGKFAGNERISEISHCVRFYGGVGAYHFQATNFPVKSQIFPKDTCQMQGCISCYSVGCIACKENWTLTNGICSNENEKIDKTQNSTAHTISTKKDTHIKKSLSCLLSDNMTKDNSCLDDPMPIKGQIALNFISAPNIGLLLKVSQIFSLVDDFMFYVYVNVTYGPQFEKFLYLMWNMSMQRWVPYSLSTFYNDIQKKSDQITKENNMSTLPKSWTDLDQDANFINNTQQFWMSSVPLTIIIFTAIHFIFRALKKYQIKFRFRIIKFKWFTILFVNIFLQNIQLLAFRTFQQIFYRNSYLDRQFKIMCFANQLVSYFTFFCVVICACAGQLIIRISIGKSVKFAVDLVWYNNSSIWFLALTQLIKIIRSFVYTNFYIDSSIKMEILFSTQVFLLLMMIFFKSNIRQKSMRLLLICEYIFRVMLHLFLLIPILLKVNSRQLTLFEIQIIDKINITIVWIIFWVSAFEILTLFIKQLTQPKQNAQAGKKQDQFNKQASKDIGLLSKLSTQLLKTLTKKKQVNKQQQTKQLNEISKPIQIKNCNKSIKKILIKDVHQKAFSSLEKKKRTYKQKE